MDFAICLDQFSTNFNVSSLSPNGFSIYTDLDYTNPIASAIPYQDLFAPPIGNCPLIVDIPQGATQILVIDACATLPTNVAPIFGAGSSANSLITQCCYAIIPVPAQPISWCDTSGLEFDVFSASYVGQIVAGNLISTLGSVTDYTIGWYKDGDYSSPEFISGYGTAFLPYGNPHPLTGNQSVPVTAGDYEGIIHDIAINGVTYSSVSGSANGTPIPFESCFDTIVVDPLTCANGPFSGSSKYSHQINFNSQAVGTTPAPVSLTYTLEPTTKYFAYAFAGVSIYDELEIKWYSGNPSSTTNPTFYSQPIYLEKLLIGGDSSQVIGAENLPGAVSPFNGQFAGVSNVWPKFTTSQGYSQRVLTLTTLETSSNPFTPDYLEITITPNPSNNNTQWIAGFQCMETFDCTDCQFEDYPNQLPKIWKVELDKPTSGCDAQRLLLHFTNSCNFQPPTSISSDWAGLNVGSTGNFLNDLNINLINSFQSPTGIDFPVKNFPASGYLSLVGATNCTYSTPGVGPCGPSSTGTITLNKTSNQTQLTFNLLSDYEHYKDHFDLLASTLSPTTCSPSSTSVAYYRYFRLNVPIQAPNANCGDNTSPWSTYFHVNDLFNIQYLASPSTNTWSITIPQTLMTNCYPPNQSCDNCFNLINQWVNDYNNELVIQPAYSYTTNTGAKYQQPALAAYITRNAGSGPSGSYCIDFDNNNMWTMISQGEVSYYPWWSVNTIPFISSSNGWINLPNLGASLPCNTGSYPIGFSNTIFGWSQAGAVASYSVRFPHLGGNGFDYSLSTNDFEIYAASGFGPTGSFNANSVFNNSPNPYSFACPPASQSLIYSYSASVATMFTSSQFWQGNTPTLIIDL
jgi:hypothetical protein